jgi:hypothetical protein
MDHPPRHQLQLRCLVYPLRLAPLVVDIVPHTECPVLEKMVVPVILALVVIIPVRIRATVDMANIPTIIIQVLILAGMLNIML